MVSFTSLSQKQWGKACKKLGLTVDKKKGKGSHWRVTGGKGTRPMTLPSDCHKFISIDIYKTLLRWGFTEEQIDDALK